MRRASARPLLPRHRCRGWRRGERPLSDVRRRDIETGACSACGRCKLACRSVWKVFGRDAEELHRRPDGSRIGQTCRGRADRRRARSRARHPPRRDLHRHGPVGLRQVDPGALPVAADRADGRRGRVRGPRPAPGQRARADRDPPPQDGHGVPAFRPAAAPDGARQRRLSAVVQGVPRRARTASARDDRARRPRRPRGASFRASSRAASSSASASPAASPSSPKSGSSTSRSRPSIR